MTPLHQQLLSRAVQLDTEGTASSVEHGLTLARTEFELASNRALHEAHCRALDAWREAQSEASLAVARRTLEAVGQQLREDSTPAKFDRVENPQWISGGGRG